MAERLREHDKTLVEGQLVLRPFTEGDWELVLPWNTDPRVLWFSDGPEIDSRTLDEVQAIYRGVSQAADVFVLEVDGRAVGDGWVQSMNLTRITAAFPAQRCARIDLKLAHDWWGRGFGSIALRLLTDHAFTSGYDLVFGVDIADYNDRSHRAFLRCGYVPWRRVQTAERPGTSFVYDLICRPDHFYGRAPVADHAGVDKIRAGDPPSGATIVVYHRLPRLEVLLLHRSALGAAYDGDWAWTPPAGARFPAEPIDHCAARELHEEAGIDGVPTRLTTSDDNWAVYLLEVPEDAIVELDEEHDRYEWVTPSEAQVRCKPAFVAASIGAALRQVL